MLVFLNKLSNIINSIVERIIFVCMVALAILNTVGVASRYLFNEPIVWSYEVTLLLFAWAIFLSISVAFKRREHMKLNFFVDRVSKSSKSSAKKIEVIILLICIIFFILGLSVTGEIMKTTIQAKYNTINVSTAWLYASFPVGAITALIHLTSELLELLSKSKM